MHPCRGSRCPHVYWQCPRGFYWNTLKSQTAWAHAHSLTQHTLPQSKCPKHNVTKLVAATVLALRSACVRPCACVFCLADRQSQCSDTDYRVPVTSYYSACAFGCARIVATCLSVTAGTCLTSWYWQVLSGGDSGDGAVMTNAANEAEGHVAPRFPELL